MIQGQRKELSTIALPCLPSGYPGRRFHMNVPSFHPLSNPPIDQHNYKAYFHFTDNLPVKNLGCRSTMISTFTTVRHLHYHPWLKDASAMLSKNPTLPPWSYTKKCNLQRSVIPAEAVFVLPNTLLCHRMLAPASRIRTKKSRKTRRNITLGRSQAPAHRHDTAKKNPFSLHLSSLNREKKAMHPCFLHPFRAK